MKVETTEHPDGTKTTKKTRWNCGCWTAIVVIFGLGLMISAWQAADFWTRVLMAAVALVVVLGGLTAWGIKQEKEAKG